MGLHPWISSSSPRWHSNDCLCWSSWGSDGLLWIGVTTNPTAEWLARQITEAFPWDTVPGFLIRDNDGAYGEAFTRRLRAMGIRDRPIARDARSRPTCALIAENPAADVWVMDPAVELQAELAV